MNAEECEALIAHIRQKVGMAGMMGDKMLRYYLENKDSLDCTAICAAQKDAQIAAAKKQLADAQAKLTGLGVT